MDHIEHEFDGNKGSFFIKKEGKRIAEMAYVMAGESRLIIDHTDVDESVRGEGVGLELLQSLVKNVRERELKVIPLCPFAKATFQKHPELQDVLS